MATDQLFSEINQIYTDTLNAAQNFLANPPSSQNGINRAKECIARLKLFRKYAAMQLGKEVLGRHSKEYKERLEKANSEVADNIRTLTSKRNVKKQEHDNLSRDLESETLKSMDHEDLNRTRRKQAGLNAKKLQLQVDTLTKEIEAIDEQISKQRAIQAENDKLLENLNTNSTSPNDFYSFILDDHNDIDSRVIDYIRKSLYALPNIGSIFLQPGNNNRLLIAKGIDGNEHIDLELLNFMISFLEHPTMRKELQAIGQFNQHFSAYVLPELNALINNSYLNTSGFGQESFPDHIHETVSVDAAKSLSQFGKFLPGFSGFYIKDEPSDRIKFYTGGELPTKIDVSKPEKQGNIDDYRKFYKELTVDLSYKAIYTILFALDVIDKEINPPEPSDELKALAIKSGNYVVDPSYKTESIDVTKTASIKNGYLYSDYSTIIKTFKDVFTSLVNMIPMKDDANRPIRDGQRLSHRYVEAVTLDQSLYNTFVTIMEQLMSHVEDFSPMNDSLALDLKRIFEPLLDMIKLEKKLNTPLSDSESETKVDATELWPDFAYQKINSEIVGAYNDFHMAALNGILIMWKRFWELEKSIDEARKQKIVDYMKKEYGLEVDPLPSENISRLSYHYTAHRTITWNPQSNELSDRDKIEREEWKEAYKKLKTIQLILNFVKAREDNEVTISPELASQLEQDLVNIMDSQIQEVPKVAI